MARRSNTCATTISTPIRGRKATTKTELRQNQFGGSLGGPIFKNKAFFFGDYSGWRLINGGLSQVLVPTADEYTAIHQFAQAGTGTITFSDPYDAWSGSSDPERDCNQRRIFEYDGGLRVRKLDSIQSSGSCVSDVGPDGELRRGQRILPAPEATTTTRARPTRSRIRTPTTPASIFTSTTKTNSSGDFPIASR